MRLSPLITLLLLTVLGNSQIAAQMTHWKFQVEGVASHSYLQSDHQEWYVNGQTQPDRPGSYNLINSPEPFQFNSYGLRLKLQRTIVQNFYALAMISADNHSFSYENYFPGQRIIPTSSTHEKQVELWKYNFGVGIGYFFPTSEKSGLAVNSGIGISYNGPYRYWSLLTRKNGSSYEYNAVLNANSYALSLDSIGDTASYNEFIFVDNDYHRVNLSIFLNLEYSVFLGNDVSLIIGLNGSYGMSPIAGATSLLHANFINTQLYSGDPGLYLHNWGFHLGFSYHFGESKRHSRRGRNGVF